MSTAPPQLDDEDLAEVPLNTDLDRKIAEAFDVFDVSNEKMCEVRDVSTILRGLGMCPSEAEIQEIIVEVEHPRIAGSVHLRHFLPIAVQAITEHKFEPSGPEDLLEAFKTLDPLDKGFLTREQITTFMTQDGEPFSQDEIDEMLELAIDPLSQTVPYEYYINQLLHEPKESDNVYHLADVIEAEKAAIQAAIEARRKFFLGGGVAAAD